MQKKSKAAATVQRYACTRQNANGQLHPYTTRNVRQVVCRGATAPTPVSCACRTSVPSWVQALAAPSRLPSSFRSLWPIAAREALGESTKDVRTGINATGLYWERPNGPVILSYTGRHHAGEIVDHLQSVGPADPLLRDVPGVPLDTNLVEQALIMPVRYFASSFNYTPKTAPWSATTPCPSSPRRAPTTSSPSHT